MKLLLKLLLIFVLIGVVLVIGSFFMGVNIGSVREYLSDNGSFSEKIDYVTSSDINELQFKMDTRNLTFYLTDEPHIHISYFEKLDDTWKITENDGVFSIQQAEKSKAWFFFFKFPSLEHHLVEIYVPKDLALEINVTTITGSIRIDYSEMQNYNAVNLTSNTGSITAKNVNVDRFNATAITGSVTLENLISAQEIFATSTTGSIHTKNVLANRISLKTTTGSITLKDSEIQTYAKANVSTGSITISNTTALSFSLASSTGDIQFTVLTHISYAYDLSVSMGSITVLGNSHKNAYQSSGDIPIDASTSTGSIKIIS